MVQIGGLGCVEKLTSPPSPLYTPPTTVVTNSLRNIPYVLAYHTTFRLGVTSSVGERSFQFFERSVDSRLAPCPSGYCSLVGIYAQMHIA